MKLVALCVSPLLTLPVLLSLSQEKKGFEESHNADKKGLIMKGYDPVSYRSEGGGEPAKGKKKLTVVYRKGTYRFATPRNRKLFLERPSHFAPAYGGWCPYAMAKNKLVDIDPESFLIEDDTLMLYFDGIFDDTRKKWLATGAETLLPRSDRNWIVRTGEPRRRSVIAYALEDGLALGGHDPVSYRSPDGPKPGKLSVTTVDRGVTYRFVNAINRETFLRDPDAFEPAFGGWCTQEMAAGKRVAADPTIFRVAADGRLLLFSKDIPTKEELRASRRQAQMHWRQMTKAKPARPRR